MLFQVVSTANDITRIEEASQARFEQRDVLTKFTISFISFLAAYTHLLCFVFACIAHAYSGGGLITLPLPLLVFFWGSLCNPRPPKGRDFSIKIQHKFLLFLVFWVVMITYTEIVILIKFIFQFGFWPWNDVQSVVLHSADVFKIQYVLGVQKVCKNALKI